MLGRDPGNAPQKRAIPQMRAGRTGSPRDGKRSTCTANPEFTRNLTEHCQRGVHTKTAKGKDTRDALTVMRKFNHTPLGAKTPPWDFNVGRRGNLHVCFHVSKPHAEKNHAEVFRNAQKSNKPSTGNQRCAQSRTANGFRNPERGMLWQVSMAILVRRSVQAFAGLHIVDRNCFVIVQVHKKTARHASIFTERRCYIHARA